MRKVAITSLLILLYSTAFAQYNKRYSILGDKAFANKDYYEAAYYYKQATGDVKQRVAVPFSPKKRNTSKSKPAALAYLNYQIGESCRLYEDYSEAEIWYYKVIDNRDTTQFPLTRLWYGVCLHADAHFDDAIKQLQQFIAEYKGDDNYIAIANKELMNCRFAVEQYQFPGMAEARRMVRDWNIDGGNYALTVNDGNYFFTSSSITKGNKEHLNRIYKTSSKALSVPVAINLNPGDDKKDAEYGTPSIDPTGKRMYFTRWYKDGSKTSLAIYLSMLKDTTWGVPMMLNSNINAEGFNAMQPFITSDGRQLYYASDKPGGQGGDDIWVSDLDVDGNPTNSTNLGPVINTRDDEQSPYYDVIKKHLVYSSKGFTGLGGFDFFESYVNNGQWSAPVNMGYPVNSSKDDLYYFPDDKDSTKSYISSDRESDCCLNIFELYDKKYVLAGKITDCDAQNPLAGVKVTFIDALTKQTIQQETVGADGKYMFNLKNKHPYHLVMEKQGYFTADIFVKTEGRVITDTLLNPEKCLQSFVVNNPIVLKNILYDFDKAVLRPESKMELDTVVKIMMDNPKIKIELGSHTDSCGTDAYNIKLSQARAQSCVDYMITKGINAARITAKGYGKTRPIAPNSMPDGSDNPEGRQLNRRTEFTVVGTE